MTCRDDGYHSVKCNVLAGGERRKPTLETDGERFRADFVDVSDILALAWPENHGFRFRKIGGQAKAKAMALLALACRPKSYDFWWGKTVHFGFRLTKSQAKPKIFSWPGFDVVFRRNARGVSPVTCSVHFSSYGCKIRQITSAASPSPMSYA
jgi:hypothetical protein